MPTAANLPLWAQLRIRYGFADADEIATFPTLPDDVTSQLMADCSPCNTSCELTPGVCQTTCEKTDQGCLAECERSRQSTRP